MGIEAHCPNGHRVKVKDDLAGRVGICPTCGERFRVPDPAAAPPALPQARLLQLEPSVVATLPRARPLGGVAAAVAPTPTSPIPFSPPPLVGSLPMPGSHTPGGSHAPLPSFPPAAPQPYGEVPDGAVPHGEVPGVGPTVRRRRVRRGGDTGGMLLAMLLLVAVVAAGAAAWIILRKQGVLP